MEYKYFLCQVCDPDPEFLKDGDKFVRAYMVHHMPYGERLEPDVELWFIRYERVREITEEEAERLMVEEGLYFL
jgi:hypothetical protein